MSERKESNNEKRKREYAMAADTFTEDELLDKAKKRKHKAVMNVAVCLFIAYIFISLQQFIVLTNFIAPSTNRQF